MFTSLIAALAVFASEPDASTQTLIDANTEARGGSAAIEAIESIEIHMTIVEGWQAEAVYRATRDGEMRIDVSIDGERVFTEALQDGRAWAMPREASTGSPITEEEARILWRGILGNLYGLHEFADYGVMLSAGTDPVTGDPMLDLVHPDGFEDRFYFDPETHLAVRQRSDHALHPAVDPEIRRHETRYHDFREVGGVTFAFGQEKYDLDSGERVQQVTIHSIGLNTISDRSVFAMPQ